MNTVPPAVPDISAAGLMSVVPCWSMKIVGTAGSGSLDVAVIVSGSALSGPDRE